jgi:NAD+ kinase
LKKTADNIKCVGLIGNPDKAHCGRVVAHAARLIRATGRQLFTEPVTARLAKTNATICTDPKQLARAVDLLLVFGGDGTMLRVARDTAGVATPMLGINIGGLGFLTAVPSDQLDRALKLIWQGGFKFERRALIEATTRIGGKSIRKLALNDIVVGRGEVARLVDLEVDVNRDPLTRYRCDGLIVSSPTGWWRRGLSHRGGFRADADLSPYAFKSFAHRAAQRHHPHQTHEHRRRHHPERGWGSHHRIGARRCRHRAAQSTLGAAHAPGGQFLL